MSDPSNPAPPKKNHIWIAFFVINFFASVGVCVFMICFNLSIQLKPDQLAHRIEELRQATAPAAHELLDLCLTRALASEGFVERIITHIAFDFAYRFPFPEVLREEVFEFLCASLFAAGETVAG